MAKKRDIAIFGRSGSRGSTKTDTEPAPEPCGTCEGDGRISIHHRDTGLDEIRPCFTCGGSGKGR